MIAVIARPCLLPQEQRRGGLCALFLTLVCAVVVPSARADDPAAYFRVISPTTTVITAFSPDGTLSWSNAVVGVTGRVQRATILTGTGNWRDFGTYTATGRVTAMPAADYLVVDLSAGPTASNYPIGYLMSSPAGGWTDVYKTTKLVMRRIPAGTFVMGSPTNELGRSDSETQHEVTLTQPFFVGVFEVTQWQWERVMGTWPSHFTNATYRDTRPVEQVSYDDIRGADVGTNWPVSADVDADSFMGRLRARTGRSFDLPTEAQWEYACRAGTTTAVNSGHSLTNTLSDAHMTEVARYWSIGVPEGSPNADTSTGTAKVGSYVPNAWGLYDCHGNVCEWCLDLYGQYPDGPVTDPKGPSIDPYGVHRRYRGGAWDFRAYPCRSAYRSSMPPGDRYNDFGFRMTVPAEPSTRSDTTAPANVGAFTATPGDGQISLTWSNPGDPDFAGVRIQRKTGGYPVDIHDGTTVYNSNGTSAVDLGLTNAIAYYYTAFSYDEVPNYADGAAATTMPSSPVVDYLVVDLSGGPTASNYPVNYLPAVPDGGWTDEYKTTKLVMRRIPAGTFTMGSPTNELGRSDDETQHQVTLTKEFHIGVFEVTQKQWERVMGTWPSYFNNTTYRDSRPVEQVSYYEIRENPLPVHDTLNKGSAITPNWPQSTQVHADSFVGKLRAKTGLATLDLPTESQWEYACRAGTTTALNSGHNLTSTSSDPRMDEVGRYWYNGGSTYSQGCAPNAGTALVGSYQANQWGLYDMHGNTYEWCLDWYDTHPGAVVDPGGAASGVGRVGRGSWYSNARGCRSANRNQHGSTIRGNDCGFRLARTLP